MSHHAASCPACRGTNLHDNGGAASHYTTHAAHAFAHGFKHGNPLWFALGTGYAAARLLYPRKLTCQGCGHSFKA